MRSSSLSFRLTPAQRWRWLFTALACTSCQSHRYAQLSCSSSTLHIRRFSNNPTSSLPSLPPPPPPPTNSPQLTRLSIPSPTTFSPISHSPSPTPPLTSAWFYHSLEDKLRDAEADAQRGNRDGAASSIQSVISELLSQSPEPSIHQLQQVKRAYIRTFKPSTLPLPLFNRIIAQSTRLQPVIVEIKRLKLPFRRDTVTALLQTAARLRSADETIATLRFIREVCVPKLRLTTEDFDGFLSVFASSGDVQGAMFMVDDMQRMGMQVGLGAYEQLLYACGRGEMVSMAMSLLEHIKASATARMQNRVSATSSLWSNSSSSAVSYPLPPSLFEHLISGLLSTSTNATFDAFPSCLSILDHMRHLSEPPQSLCQPPTAALYSTLIAAYRKRGRILEAHDTYISMRRDRLLLPTADFNALLAAVAKSSEADGRPGEGVNRAMQMMRERIEAHKREGGEPIDVSSFNLLLDVGMQQRRQDAITVVLKWMDASGCKRDVATYNKLIERYARTEEEEPARKTGRTRAPAAAAAAPSDRRNPTLVLALQTYHELLTSSLQPDLTTFHTLMTAAGVDDDHWLLWCVLDDMETARVRPVEKTFQLALEAAEKSDDGRGRWVLPFFTKLSNSYARLASSTSDSTDTQPDPLSASALTSATSAIPNSLQHRDAAKAELLCPPASSLTLPTAFPRLGKATYDQYIDALARSEPLPLPLVLGFVNGMTAAGQQVTRQNMKELMMARAERADQDGVLALMGVMMREGMGVDADVVHSLLRVISQRAELVSGKEEERGRAEIESYVTAIDEQLIQPEQRAEHRIQSLNSLFEGLCGPRLPVASTIAVRVLQLLQEREGVKVTPRQMQALFHSLQRHSAAYVQRATQLVSLMPMFGLNPTVQTLTDFASHTHSVDDVKLLLATIDKLQMKGDAAFYAALLHRQLSMASASQEMALLLSIVQRMIKDSVRLPSVELSQLIHAARLRQNSNVMLYIWRYMRAVDVSVTAKWLADMARLCRHRDASMINVRWAHELTNYAIERLSATDDGWNEMVEALLILQVPLQPRDNMCLQLLMAVKHSGKLTALNSGDIYEAAMAALHSRLDKPTEDDKLTIRGLLAAEAGQPDVWSVEMRRLLTRALDNNSDTTGRSAGLNSADQSSGSDDVTGATPWVSAVANVQSVADLPPLCTSSVAPTQMRDLPAFYWHLLQRYFALVQRPPGTAHMRDFCHLLTQMQAQQVCLSHARLLELQALCSELEMPGYTHRLLLYMAEVGLELDSHAINTFTNCREKKVPLDTFIALRLNHWRVTMLKWAARTATDDSLEMILALFRGSAGKVNNNDVWQLWQAMIDLKQGHMVYERPALSKALIAAGSARKQAFANGVVLSASDILQLTEAVHSTYRQAVAKMSEEGKKEAFHVKQSLLGLVEKERKWREVTMAQKRKGGAQGKAAIANRRAEAQQNGQSTATVHNQRQQQTKPSHEREKTVAKPAAAQSKQQQRMVDEQ